MAGLTKSQNKLKTADRSRLGGSSFTVFLWQNELIAFARQIAYQSPTPVGPGTVPIHPLDAAHPVELLTPAAATMGSLTLELYELYHEKVWERLAGLTGVSDTAKTSAQGNTKSGSRLVDIVAVFRHVYNLQTPITIAKVIKPPKGRGLDGKTYAEYYRNCVVSQVMDGETIEVGTMEVLKQMVINFTHVDQAGGPNDNLKPANLGTPSTVG